jgi:hypothetical protein
MNPNGLQNRSWKYDLVTSDLIWSKGHYQIFELEELPPDQLNAAARLRTP